MQFAALRSISRHLDAAMDASTASTRYDYDFNFETETESGSGKGKGSDADAGWGAARLAGDAAELQQAMRLCRDLLTDEAISLTERGRCATELELLRDRCWELMDRYLRQGCAPRAAREQGRERPSSRNYGRDGSRPVGAEGFRGARVEMLRVHRVKMLERGAAGWIAC
jgi:hypothetical protein